LRDDLLGPNCDTLIGYVGRVTREKQLNRLEMLRYLPNTRLVVVGDGPYRKRLAREMPWVIFLGYRSGEILAAAVASLDIFVHTGTHDTFCQSVQEALASGVPVVAFDAGGIPDLVSHEDNGLLVPCDNPSRLRVNVQRLVDNPEERRRLSLAARDSVIGRSWEHIVAELLQHYEQILTEQS
jgi:phosphatidylinositol alpha 1,6-mannosyltransferase